MQGNDKGLKGVNELGTETLLMIGKRKKVNRRVLDDNWHKSS